MIVTGPLIVEPHTRIVAAPETLIGLGVASQSWMRAISSSRLSTRTRWLERTRRTS